MTSLVGWYIIMALITCAIGGYRSWKYNIEQDELAGLSWILCWWIYLPYFIIRETYLKIKTRYESK